MEYIKSSKNKPDKICKIKLNICPTGKTFIFFSKINLKTRSNNLIDPVSYIYAIVCV